MLFFLLTLWTLGYLFFNLSPSCPFFQMSLSRFTCLKRAIPIRGLEEFLSSSTTAGKDVVYGKSFSLL